VLVSGSIRYEILLVQFYVQESVTCTTRVITAIFVINCRIKCLLLLRPKFHLGFILYFGYQ